MTQEPLTLYKLIVLYMLNRVTFPLTKAQISDFVLNHDYTDFLTLQQVISQLHENNMVTSKTVRNRTQLFITEEGKSTLSFFENRVSDAIKQEIDDYLDENGCQFRNEISVTAEYYKTTGGEYETRLVAKEKDTNLVTVTLTVPTEATASNICDNWQSKNQDIYKFLTEQLF